MAVRQPRSRAHRGLQFEYLLGLSLVVLGLAGMAAMQARLLMLAHDSANATPMFGVWRGEQSFDGDDVRSLSDNLRVCGDGFERAVELECWRDQMAALLPARSGAATALPRHRMVVHGVERDVIVFGGRPNRQSGPGLTLADAASGAILWHARQAQRAGYDSKDESYGHPMLTATIGDEIAAVDGDRDGIIDRLYVGDEGGRLWRVDLAGIPDGKPRSADQVVGDLPSLWRMAPIFSAESFSAETAQASSSERGFQSRPDVVQASDSHGRYDAVIIGSTGDQAVVENWFYMVKDRAVVSGMPLADSGLRHDELRDLSERCAATEICKGGRSGLENGWRLRLASTGERFTGHALTAAGSVLYTTWTPFGDGCDGRRMLYAVSLRDARPSFRIDSTLERDPVAREIMEIIARASQPETCHVANNSG